MSDLRKLPRLFKVIRHRDLKKVSGIGKVIDGVVFSDGQVVVQWQNDTHSISVFRNLQDFQNTHVKPIFNENEFIWHKGYSPSDEVSEAINNAIEFVSGYERGRISNKTKGDITGKLIAIKKGHENQQRGGLSPSYLRNLERNQAEPIRIKVNHDL